MLCVERASERLNCEFNRARSFLDASKRLCEASFACCLMMATDCEEQLPAKGAPRFARAQLEHPHYIGIKLVSSPSISVLLSALQVRDNNLLDTNLEASSTTVSNRLAK